MKGTVYNINSTRGMVGVKVESGNFSVFEMLSDDNFHIGDELEWKEHNPLGDCKIKNGTENEFAEVYFQNHDVPLQNLKSRLLYN